MEGNFSFLKYFVFIMYLFPADPPFCFGWGEGGTLQYLNVLVACICIDKHIWIIILRGK